MKGLELLEAPPTGCPVRIVLAGLTGEQRHLVLPAVENQAVSSRKLHQFFRLNDIKIGRESINAHRNGECDCDR